MIRHLIAALIGCLAVLASPAFAQTSYPPGSTSILGIFTIASLPACDASKQAKYSFVTDLGGGPDMVLCDGSGWKHIRLGTPATLSATSGTVTITPLASAPINLLTGGIATSLNVSISSVGLYDGEIFYFRRPGVLTGSIGISLASGGTSLPLLGNQSMMVVYSATCTCLVQVQ